MKRYSALAVALTLAGLAAVALPQAAEPTTQPAMVTTYTARVRITWAHAGASFSPKSIIDLLKHPSVLCQVLPEELDRHVKNLRYISFKPLLSFGQAPSQRGYVLGGYYMGFGEPVKEATARKGMEMLVDQLRRLLLAEYKTYRSQIRRKLDHAARAQGGAYTKLGRLQAVLEATAKASTRADVTWKLENNRTGASGLAAQLRQVDVEQAAKKERLKAIREQIAKLSRDAATQASAKDEPAVTKLRELVAAQKRELQDLRRKVGPEHRSVKALQGKFASLEAQLAKAFLDQEARRDAALKGAGTPELIRKLKAEGIALMIDLREMDARLVALRKQLLEAEEKDNELLAQLRDWQTAKMQMERIKVDLSLAVKRYERASTGRDELNQQLSSLEPPTVTILKPPGRTATRPKGGK